MEYISKKVAAYGQFVLVLMRTSNDINSSTSKNEFNFKIIKCPFLLLKRANSF